MKNIFKEKLTGIASLTVAIVSSSICFAQQPVELAYNFPASTPVKYLTESKIILNMDIMGQAMQVNVNSVFGCSVKAAGLVDKNLKLEVTVDTIGQLTESPMGSTGGAVKDVQGKVFNIVINPKGKSVDISEAEKIVYNIEGSGESNLAETFVSFFPVLPSDPVKPGDTWNSTDSINTRSNVMSMKMTITSENKMEGFETIDGVECVKISAVLSGNRAMTIRNQDVDQLIKGPFTGTANFFFSVRDGYFIRQVVISRMTGTLEMTAPEVMTFPIVMDTNTVIEVRK